MKQWIKDAVLLGILLWLIGYLASLALFVSPYAGVMGWILLIVFTPVTIAITWWWFRKRELAIAYYVKVGVAWVALAVVLDFLFIVLLFHAAYYGSDVFVYYAVTFLIPVGVGLSLCRGETRKGYRVTNRPPPSPINSRPAHTTAMNYTARHIRRFLETGKIDPEDWKNHFPTLLPSQVPSCAECSDLRDTSCMGGRDPVDCFLAKAEEANLTAGREWKKRDPMAGKGSRGMGSVKPYDHQKM